MYRNEFKYVINPHQKNTIADKLSKICRRDSYSDANGRYLVSSLYFDDYDQSALIDKLNGIRDRKKFRVRVYNHQTNVIKLERKEKRDYLTRKSYVQLSKEEYDALVSGDAGFLRNKENVVAKDFYLLYQIRNLRPRVVVEYYREAYVYRYGDVRISFDSFLKAGAFNRDLFSNGYLISAIPHDQIILEVKYTAYLPDCIRSIIQTNILKWQSCSKYVLGCLARV